MCLDKQQKKALSYCRQLGPGFCDLVFGVIEEVNGNIPDEIVRELRPRVQLVLGVNWVIKFIREHREELRGNGMVLCCVMLHLPLTLEQIVYAIEKKEYSAKNWTKYARTVSLYLVLSCLFKYFIVCG
jgi:hypothetical protein